MKALVTGGLGFIGSHLVDRLVSDGWEVTVIDSAISGDPMNLSAATLSRTRVITRSISACRSRPFRGYDALFHMAAYPIRRDRLFDYRIYFEQTEGGTLAALEIARKNAIPLFVMPASTTLYGSAKHLGTVPTSESFVGPDISFYGTSKFNSERWCEAYSGLFDMDVLITRFGRILGPRSRNGSVWELARRLLAYPEHLDVLGDGTASRSFLHVSDCVAGIMTAMTACNKGVDRFNVANNDTATVRELVEILVQESGLNPTVTYGEDKVGWKGDNEMVFPDSSKLRQHGWAPRLDSRETIRDCVRWTLANAS